MSALTDLAARQTGATCFDKNLVVVAGAGTGKTSLLVERLLNLLLSETVSLENVVVTTFTKKAAAELNERVASALVALGQGEISKGTEAHRSWTWLTTSCGLSGEIISARAKDISLNLDRATLSTLHSYAADILRRHPVETGMAPNFKPDLGETRRLLMDELWPRFLDNELQDSSPRHKAWRSLLKDVSVGDIEEVATLLVRRPQALDHLINRGYQHFDLREVFGEKAKELRIRLQELLPETPKGLALSQLVLQIQVLGQFLSQGKEGLEITLDPESKLQKFWEKGYTGGLGKYDQREKVISAVKDTAKALGSWRKTSRVDMQALADILQAFGLVYQREVASRGVPAMDDLLILARNLLAHHPHIRAAEAQRIKIFLVDEFQDTDPIQYEILFLLSAQEHPQGDISLFQAPLVPGKVFIVGDPKQSIYRFRGADMESYNRAVRAIVDQGGELLALTNNFRSVEPIILGTNSLFESYIGEDSDRSVNPEYHPLNCARKDSTGRDGVEIWSVTNATALTGTQDCAAEARVVATAICDLLQQGVSKKDIALLFRATTRLPHYTRALDQAGLAFVVDGGKSFSERPEVIEGLAILRTLANPADPVACVAAFRWTFGSVPDEELVSYTQAGGTYSWQASPRTHTCFQRGEFPNLKRVVATLQELHRIGKTLPVDRFIHRVLLESDLPLMQAAYSDASQRLANLHKLAQRTAAIARDYSLSLDQTLTVLEDNLAGDAQEWESPLADEAVDAIRLLTIHKSKGLEFPVVFLPDLPKAPKGRGGGGYVKARFTLGDLGGNRCLGIEFRGRDVPTLAFEERDRKHEEAENKRLLYVAMTRARNRLIIVASSKDLLWKEGFKQWGYDPEDLKEETLGGGVKHRLIPTSIDLPQSDGTIPKSAHESVLRLTQHIEALQQQEIQSSFRTPSTSDDHEDAKPQSTLQSEEAKNLGNLMHLTMERWDFNDPGDVSAQLAQLLEMGNHSKPVIAGAKEMAVTLETSDLAEHLRQIDVLGREVPLLYQDGVVTVHGYADLVYREGNRIVAADYKTDTYQGSPQEAGEVHRNQLMNYARAVQKAFGLTELPIPEVIFLRTGERVRLEASLQD